MLCIRRASVSRRHGFMCIPTAVAKRQLLIFLIQVIRPSRKQVHASVWYSILLAQGLQNMGHFNNRNMNGFSFIEVILTIALIGAVVTPVLVVQFNVLQFLSRSSGKIRTIFLLDSLFP